MDDEGGGRRRGGGGTTLISEFKSEKLSDVFIRLRLEMLSRLNELLMTAWGIKISVLNAEESRTTFLNYL